MPRRTAPRPGAGEVTGRRRARHSSRPRLEILEERIALTVFTWTGAGATSNWDDADNWGGHAAPPNEAAPVDLVFGADLKGSTNLTNDIPGLVVNSIEFLTNYTISGKALTVSEAPGADRPSGFRVTANENAFITPIFHLEGLTLDGSLMVDIPNQSNGIALNSDFDDFNSGDRTATFSGDGTLTKMGDGSLGYPITQGGDDYRGQVVVNRGKIRIGSSKKVRHLRLEGGVIDIARQVIFIGSGDVGGRFENSEGGGLSIVPPDANGDPTGVRLTTNGEGGSGRFVGTLEVQDGGRLRVEGAYDSSVTTVQPGGTLLGGGGIVGPLSARRRGTVILGDSAVENLEVIGDADLASDDPANPSTLSILVDGDFPAVSSQLIVSNTAHLAGAKLVIDTVNAPRVGTKFTIVQATDGIDGTFANLADGAEVVGGNATYVVHYEPVSGDFDPTLRLVTLTVQSVTAIPTSTRVDVPAGRIVFGQPATFTAIVSPASGTRSPTGSVTFFRDGVSLGPATLDASGEATLVTSSLPVGTYTITAKYGGVDDRFARSNSPAISQRIYLARTTTTVKTSSSRPVFGQRLRLTAMVVVSAPGAGTPSGMVRFFDRGRFITRVRVNSSGSASFTTSTLGVGTHSFTAEYAGAANRFASSHSSEVSRRIYLARTTTKVMPSGARQVFGQRLRLTAKVVVSAPGAGTPRGLVKFYDAGGFIGQGTLNSSGQASYSTTALIAGTHTITATFVGVANQLASSKSPSVSQRIYLARTTTRVRSLDPAPVFGQRLILRATVAVSAPGAGTPAGLVNFFDGERFIGQAELDSSGRATLPTSTLSVGPHSITAAYGGEANRFASSRSEILTQQVNSSGTSRTSMASNPGTSAGQTSTSTATFTRVSPGAGASSGVAAILEGPRVLGNVPATASTTTYSTADNPGGSHIPGVSQDLVGKHVGLGPSEIGQVLTTVELPMIIQEGTGQLPVLTASSRLRRSWFPTTARS